MSGKETKVETKSLSNCSGLFASVKKSWNICVLVVHRWLHTLVSRGQKIAVKNRNAREEVDELNAVWSLNNQSKVLLSWRGTTGVDGGGGGRGRGGGSSPTHC